MHRTVSQPSPQACLLHCPLALSPSNGPMHMHMHKTREREDPLARLYFGCFLFPPSIATLFCSTGVFFCGSGCCQMIRAPPTAVVVLPTVLGVAAAGMSSFDLLSSVKDPSAVYHVPRQLQQCSSCPEDIAVAGTAGVRKKHSCSCPPRRVTGNHRHACLDLCLLRSLPLLPLLSSRHRECHRETFAAKVLIVSGHCPDPTLVLEAGGEGRRGRQNQPIRLTGRCSVGRK